MTTDPKDCEPLVRVSGTLPEPVLLPRVMPPMIACGPETGNSFCLSVGNRAYVSHDIGDLRDPAVYDSYLEGIEFFKCQLGVEPEIAVHDLHPDYMSTRYAEVCGAAKLIPVQHHHAHAVACMYENGLSDRTIAVTFDGMGLGDDGTIWGGEFLCCDLGEYERKGHLKAYPLPGGDQGTLYPERMAFSCLASEFGAGSSEIDHLLSGLSDDDRGMLGLIIEKGVNSPMTSSVGRLFDAVAAMLGFTGKVAFPAEAAIKLQASAKAGEKGRYAYDISGLVLSFGGMFDELCADMRSSVDVGIIAARFHNTLAAGTVEMCRAIRDEEGLEDVVLSGGVFYNGLLCTLVTSGLSESGFNVHNHKMMPPGDVCLSLGQSVAACLKEGVCV